MEKLGRLIKELSRDRIKDFVKDSNSIIVIKYSGLSSIDLDSLRSSLKKSNARLFVVKNSVCHRALKDIGLEALIKSVEGPCGLVFTEDEPVAASKILCNFSKDHEALIFEGGILKDNHVIEKKDIELMARLPSKGILRAQLVATLNAPIQGLAMTLNQVIRKFVCCLEEIKQKRETQKKGAEDGTG